MTRMAVLTKSFATDFELCVALNRSVLDNSPGRQAFLAASADAAGNVITDVTSATTWGIEPTSV